MKPEQLILIHGAWAGAWVWDYLVKALQEYGWNVKALDLPGDGFHSIEAKDVTERDYLNHLYKAMEQAEGPVALVGHSGGGMLVTLAANAFPDRVSHGVWIAGFLLPNGHTYDEIQQQLSNQKDHRGAMHFIESSNDGPTTTIPAQAAKHLFFQDATDEVANEAANKLTAQPVCGARIRTITGDQFNTIPKLYLLATEDNSILPAAQRLMCQGVSNITVNEIRSGHTPQLTQPSLVAQHIDTWITNTLP